MRKILWVLIFIALPVSSAFAWGVQGHKIVALIAEQHLTPQAKAGVEILLFTENDKSLADIASWADAIRDVTIPRQPSHIVRLPLDTSDYSPKTECKADMCILGAIKADIAVLRDPKARVESKVMALKYLVHFIGDIHQPLHASADPGAWPVLINGREVEFHHVWDSEIISFQKAGSIELAKRIESDKSVMPPVEDIDPVEWAIEGRDIARDVIFPGLYRYRHGDQLDIPEQYLSDNWHTVEIRLKQGGYRLAFLLNDIFRDHSSE